MLEVTLEDVAIEPLRREAQRLGIPDVGSKSKDDLIALIRQERARRRVTKPPWTTPTVISFISLFFALLAVIANWQGIRQSDYALQLELKRRNELDSRAEKEQWQKLIVYSIIEKNFSAQEDPYVGVQFETIQNDFLNEARIVQHLDLAKEDIQPYVLRKVLLELIETQVVYVTLDQGYAIELSDLLPDFGSTSLLQRAAWEVIHLLSQPNARLSEHELRTLITDKFKITSTQFVFIVVQLVNAGYVVRDEDGMLTGASSTSSSSR